MWIFRKHSQDAAKNIFGNIKNMYPKYISLSYWFRMQKHITNSRFSALKCWRVDTSFSMQVCSYVPSLLISCLHRFEHYSRGLASLWAHLQWTAVRIVLTHLRTTSISRFCAAALLNNLTNTFITLPLTGLVGGDGDRHTLGCPCTAGLGDAIARVDNEGVVCVGPELAHHHPGGLQAGLAGREEHIGATGQAELRAGARVQLRVISRRRPALENTSPWLAVRSHNPLVRLHPQATVLSLGLGDAAIPGEGFSASLTAAPCLTDETLQTVAGVTSSSKPARRGPLQDHRGLIHHGDELLWGWRRLWGRDRDNQAYIIYCT